MKKLRVGLIGARDTGMPGLRLHHLAAGGRAKLAAVCCRTEQTRRGLMQQYGVAGYERYDDLLADKGIDAVIISTPNDLHYPIALAALEAGKNVCVEYPLCDSVEQHDALTDLARRRKLVLHHGMNTRLEFLYGEVKENLHRIGQPILAEVTYFAGAGWYRDPNRRGSMFAALHIAFIDYYTGFFGPPRWLTAAQSQVCASDARHSLASVTLGFDGPVVGTVTYGTETISPPRPCLTVVGTDGYIRGDHGKVEILCGKNATRTEITSLPGFDPLAGDTDNFIAQILDGEEALCTLDYSRQLIARCCACTQSAASGRRIQFE